MLLANGTCQLYALKLTSPICLLFHHHPFHSKPEPSNDHITWRLGGAEIAMGAVLHAECDEIKFHVPISFHTLIGKIFKLRRLLDNKYHYVSQPLRIYTSPCSLNNGEICVMFYLFK